MELEGKERSVIFIVNQERLISNYRSSVNYREPESNNFFIDARRDANLKFYLRRPSSSMPEEGLRQEYIDAENVKETEECLGMYSSCELNIYDFVTFREA